ncbi:hypothetical protein LXL04_012928 [Taraxacum kok-saghyz]
MLQKSSEVIHALEEHGAFIAKYDGVLQELHGTVFLASRNLFDLPTKIKIRNTSQLPNNGYSRIFHEGMDIDNATTEQGVENFTKLTWPSGNEKFRYSFLIYDLHLTSSNHNSFNSPDFQYKRIEFLEGCSRPRPDSNADGSKKLSSRKTL